MRYVCMHSCTVVCTLTAAIRILYICNAARQTLSHDTRCLVYVSRAVHVTHPPEYVCRYNYVVHCECLAALSAQRNQYDMPFPDKILVITEHYIALYDIY